LSTVIENVKRILQPAALLRFVPTISRFAALLRARRLGVRLYIIPFIYLYLPLLTLISLDFVAWIKPEKEAEFCMVNREFPRILVGHFVPFPNARANGPQSETLWHTLKFSHFCFLLSAFCCFRSGIAIFTCVRLAYKREAVKRKFRGQMKYFGNLLQPTNGDFEGDSVPDWQEFANGTDPIKIIFQISFTNQHVNLANVPEIESRTP
jgi:hypothetical protein